MISRHAPGWQLILADLALILFLVVLSALAIEETENSNATPHNSPHIAASQALFRSSDSGPTIAEWLGERPVDSRATLTIVAQYVGEDRDAVWQEAQALADSARGNGFAVRTVISSGPTSDIYASLAYDSMVSAQVAAP